MGGCPICRVSCLVEFLEKFNQLLKKHAVERGEEQHKVFYLVKVLFSADTMVTVSKGSFFKLYSNFRSNLIRELLA